MKIHSGLLIGVAVACAIISVPPVFAKTAKECTAEWRADKAGMQGRGVTQKAYVEQCKTGAASAPPPKPAVATPATPAAPSPSTSTSSTQKTAKECIAEWRADKAGMQARGVTESNGLAGPNRADELAQQPSPSKDSATLEAGQFADEASAKSRCPTDTVVWVNLPSKVYHFAGTKSYGTTKRGAYMCEKEAIAAEDRASKTERHP